MDLHQLTVAEAVALLNSGQASAVELAQALLARQQALSGLNAFISIDPDSVLAAAAAADETRAAGGSSRALLGIPLVLKDNIDTAGVMTTAGTPALRSNIPAANAPVAQALFDAGAYCFGKTNLHELAYGVTCNNGAFGPTGNPYDSTRIPGGSSGGTGTAVGARLAPAGLGSDTGGSVRVPAALCGITGLRPSSGRYSQQGVVPISSTRDTVGPMTRSVADAALLDGIICGHGGAIAPADLKGLRLGVPRGYYYEMLDSETASVMEAALSRLADYGVTLVEVDVEGVAQANEAASMPVALFETSVTLNAYLSAHGLDFDYAAVVAEVASPDVKGLLDSLMGDDAIPEEVYLQALNEARPKLRALFTDFFATNDLAAIVFPTTPMPAAKIGEDETVNVAGEDVPTFMTYIRNTDPASNAALPGLSMPAGMTATGLPVGMEFDGPEGSDETILAIGMAVEANEPAWPEPALDT
ncbi:MAG TPA: indoleacetamide hydrolase [Alphaproteobacteria bacterium]|jgi:mandelamide amidase|nr:indoleacetamide hydrolase [Alphaproteobacteria bacterium]HJM50174.1 indoleacetamide hydrolase [Alphaproteobacteria bacterium]